MVMPNSRERFEAEFTRTWPEYVRLTPDVFNRVGDGAYVDGTIHVAFVMWQAGAAAERERINAFHSITRRAIVMAAAEIGAQTKGETA